MDTDLCALMHYQHCTTTSAGSTVPHADATQAEPYNQCQVIITIPYGDARAWRYHAYDKLYHRSPLWPGAAALVSIEVITDLAGRSRLDIPVILYMVRHGQMMNRPALPGNSFTLHADR